MAPALWDLRKLASWALLAPLSSQCCTSSPLAPLLERDMARAALLGLLLLLPMVLAALLEPLPLCALSASSHCCRLSSCRKAARLS
jgi:hypothetical protein